MSMFGSQRALNTMSRQTGSRTDLAGGGYQYARSDVQGGNGYGQEYTEVYTFSKGSGGGGQVSSTMTNIHQQAYHLQSQCNECLHKAELILQNGGPRAAADAEQYMLMSRGMIDQLKALAIDLKQMGQPNDNVVKSLEQLRGVHMALSGTMQRRSRGSRASMSWEEPNRSFMEAVSWIKQQKRLIETSQWGDDPTAIEQQIHSHSRFHSSIQRSAEVDRARDDLRGDKASLHALEQEWEGLQKLSFARSTQLRELQSIIEEISREIMWVNDKEEEELVFDWGHKNIDTYIPQKQESYSRLMSELEQKEKDLNKLKLKVDGLLKNNHPASDKIEAYMDTLQTQWSWLLQITKCIHVHLKENAAYSQFFKEANDTYSQLQKEHESIRKKFTCDKTTPLQNMTELLKKLEREREHLTEYKQQVQHLVNKAKSIVRLRPRNPGPEEKSSSPVIVQALCDFKQDQKVICKGDEGILKNNSERSKWLVTGPGGLDMEVPSVCLLVPPPNPLSITLANKNEQYYEAILAVWNQLYINIKSLISWQYCIQDINHINSLTITMLSKMRPEEYRSIIKSLETHYQEFQRHSLGSELFGDEDKRSIETKYSGAQKHYEQLVVQLPTAAQSAQLNVAQVVIEAPKPQPQPSSHVVVVTTDGPAVAPTSQTGLVSAEATQKTQTKPKPKVVTSQSTTLLSELHALRLRLEGAESSLTTHLHIPLDEDAPAECTQHIILTQVVQNDIASVGEQFEGLRERVLKELEGMDEADTAQFLRSQLELIGQRLSSLDAHATAYAERLKALRSLFQATLQAEDVVKLFEARLTERDTTCLDPAEVQEYQSVLKSLQSELQQRKGVLSSLEVELNKARQYNGQMEKNCHRCDVDLAQHTERVGQLLDRWHRIQNQIDSRLGDLDLYLQQLQQYLHSSSALSEWIDGTKGRLDAQQATKTDDIAVFTELLNTQKALNSEIKDKRETVETVQRENDTCVSTIKNYELDLASYSAGLETLLNIPIKRRMLQSPSTELIQEASTLHARYIELLTRSSHFYKHLGISLKNMEDLKMRSTKIEMLEEELRLLREDLQDQGSKNASLQEALAQYQLQLNESQDHLLSLEEVKRNQALQCNATKDSLDSSQSQLEELNAKLASLQLLIGEEERKRKIAEEMYATQQEEYEEVMRKRQKELEEANWAKVELEKVASDRARDAENLRRQLEDEVQQVKEAQMELSKTSSMIQASQSQCSELQQERDDLMRKLKMMEQGATRTLELEEELMRIKLSLESELQLKRSLQEDNEKIKKEFGKWKSQRAEQESRALQEGSERSRLEGECTSLRSKVEQLQLSLKEVEERYALQLQSMQQQHTELLALRDSLQEDLLKLRQQPDTSSRYTQTDKVEPSIDPATLVFNGVRKTVTAQQLRDCGVINQVTYEQLVKGKQSVQDVAINIKLNLKGTGIIAGVAAGPKGRMTMTEAKREKLLSDNCAIMLLEAQAATGHIVDPRSNRKMTVEEAEAYGLVEAEDTERLLVAEAAAVGFRDPNSGKLLSAGQAMRKGMIDQETALRLLQAQEAVGGILDPALSVFLPRDTAMDRDLVDEDLYQLLNEKPQCYIDQNTGLGVSYITLKRQCKATPTTGLLLLSAPEKPLTVQGLRGEVPISNLVDSKLLERSDLDQLREGKLTSQDIEHRLRSYLRGSTCIAGVYDESNKKTLPIYQAMKEGLLRPGTTMELLEAQAASGFVIDPVNNLHLTVEDACKKGLVGVEFKDKLLSAERAVTGYKDPGSDKIISLFQAIERRLIERGHGIRLLEAQLASGGIIDPKQSHRIDVDVAYQKGYLDKQMNQILKDEGEDTKGFFDPNTQENLTYRQLKSRCITEEKTGLVLLPLHDKSKQETQKNTLRKRRVVIVDPDTNKEMTVREAYDRKLIDYETFVELSKQECEWEEITITASDGSTRLIIIDRRTGVQYDLQDLQEKGIIENDLFGKYRSGEFTLTQFADLIMDKTQSLDKPISSSTSSTKHTSKTSIKSETVTTVQSMPPGQAPSSPTTRKRIASVSITLTSPGETTDEQSPVGAIFDTENLQKLSVSEALKRGLVDSITAQRLLEAQACTGGIVNPENGRRISIQEATRLGILSDEMANRLKPAQKAYIGFEDIKSKRKMSAAEAVKEKWLPYEAGQRFLEFQFLTGGLFDPEIGCRRTMEDVMRLGWLDSRAAKRLLDTRHYPKMLTCPKTKLRISYREALEGCMVEEDTGVRMLPASTTSSRGISSPYNSFSAPGSASGSRRGSVDLSFSSSSTSKFTSYSYSRTSFSSSSQS